MWPIDCMLFIWGKMMIPMCRLLLECLYGFWCLRKAIELNHSLTWTHIISTWKDGLPFEMRPKLSVCPLPKLLQAPWLTHWSWDKTAVISHTTFSNAFSCMKMCKFRLNFTEVWINNITALVQIMAWRWPSNKPLSEPTMVSMLTHICVTRLQWVKAHL